MKGNTGFVSYYQYRNGFSSVLAKCKEMWGLDHRSLALFRVLLGIVCFGDTLLKYGDVEAFYTDDGIISRKTMYESFGAWYDLSFHTMSGRLGFQKFLFYIHFLLSLLLIVGWKTRLVTIALYFWTRSIQDRLLLVLHSGDDVHRILLLWSILLPLGSCYSIDSCGGFRQLCSSSSSSTANSSSKKNTKKPPFTLSFATFGLLVQMGILYFVSVFHKRGPEWRTDYTATYFAVQMDYYRTALGDLFLVMPQWTLQVLTWSVWWWEACGPFLLVFPIVKTPWVRTFAAFGFAMLHIGLGACMRLGQFIWICVVVEFAYLPPQLWDWIENRLRTKERLGLKVYCNQPSKNVSFSRYLVTLFKTFFLIPETRILDLNFFDEKGDIESNASSKNAQPTTWLMVETLSGTQFKNADALVVLYKHSPLLWPFAGLVSFTKPFINKVFGTLQRLTTTEATTSVFGIFVTPAPAKSKTASSRMRRKAGRLAINVVAAFIVVAVVVWNFSTVSFIKAPNGLAEFLHITGFEQTWRMFSPGPPHHHFWHVIQATLVNGQEVELFKDGALWSWIPNEPFTFTHPKDQFITYNSHPWYKFWESFNWNEESETLRLNFGRWICREYNKRYGGTPRQLKNFNIWINWEGVNLDNTRTPGEREILWQHVC